MTLVGLLGLWLTAKLLDAFATANNLNPFGPTPAPAPPTPAPQPRRGPSRRPRNGGAPSPGPVPTPTPAPVPGPLPPAPGPVNPAVHPGEVFTPPWPQVVPSGLPSFPGGGWEPDNPPPPAVVQRAFSLLNELWKGGPGTFKVEKTAARWIAYQATQMGDKKGVVAFRLRGQQTLPSGGGGTSNASTALPFLRKGSRGQDVVILQKKLGIAADGVFGSGTDAAVREFQRRRGLQVDGVVGPATWAALMGQQAA